MPRCLWVRQDLPAERTLCWQMVLVSGRFLAQQPSALVVLISCLQFLWSLCVESLWQLAKLAAHAVTTLAVWFLEVWRWSKWQLCISLLHWRVKRTKYSRGLSPQRLDNFHLLSQLDYCFFLGWVNKRLLWKLTLKQFLECFYFFMDPIYVI